MTKLDLPEGDFDEDPVLLYMALQDKKWSEAMAILEKTPEEARTWVFRKGPQGAGVRWRLLPIHGAIIFQAPPEVIESLLLIFPEGSSCKDDEGSLPIHLAYKRGSSEAIVTLLLDAFPASIDAEDRKGRTPKTLATSSTGSKHREFVSAIKSHLLAIQAARVAASAADRRKMDRMLEEKNKELLAMQQRNAELGNELMKTQEASQVLVNHVNDLEEQLTQKEHTEKHLQVKVETLEDDLETAFRGKDEYQNEMQAKVTELNEQLLRFQEQVNQLLLEKDVLNESLDQVVASAEMEKKELVDANAVLEKKFIKLRDGIHGQATVSRFQFEELKRERNMLRVTVAELNDNMRKVDSCLGAMKEEQEAIVEEAERHEVEMLVVTKEHARILMEVHQQQEKDVEAQHGRDQIESIIRTQEESYAKNTEGRKHIVDSIDLHTRKVTEDDSRKRKMVRNVKALQEKIEKTRLRVNSQINDETTHVVEVKTVVQPQFDDEHEKSSIDQDEVREDETTLAVEAKNETPAKRQAQEQRQFDDGYEKSSIDEEEVREEPGETSTRPKTPSQLAFQKHRQFFEEEKKADDEDERDAPEPTNRSRVLSAFV